MKLEFLEAGEIVTTHGVRGEMKIYPWSDGPEFLLDFDRVLIDGKVYARGTSDMKSGLAAMAYTLAAIVKSGKRPMCDIPALLMSTSKWSISEKRVHTSAKLPRSVL